jgi:beta-lactam-binding protein with PASTA domain
VANEVATVPNIRGVTLDQAQQRLSRAGLALGVIDPGDPPRDARVDFQNPAAGTDARLGSAVNVVLAVAEEATPTPTATPTVTP